MVNKKIFQEEFPMKHIVLTGGGTAGHVTPNIALIPTLKAAGYQISYIGSYEGIERKLIEEMGIPYYGISQANSDVTLILRTFPIRSGFSKVSSKPGSSLRN